MYIGRNFICFFVKLLIKKYITITTSKSPIYGLIKLSLIKSAIKTSISNVIINKILYLIFNKPQPSPSFIPYYTPLS